MLQDMEKHKITLLEKPNPHILVTGKSGYGKTFFCTQLINEKILVGKKVLIVDFSNSYTEEELKKSKFKHEKFAKTLNPATENIEWEIKCNKKETFVEEIASALMEALGVKAGYMPKKVLLEGVEKIVNRQNTFVFSDLFQTFENMLEEEKNDEADNMRMSAIRGMLSRFMTYRELSSIQVVPSQERKRDFYPVTILQLSDYSDINQEQITRFFISLIWSETRRMKEKKSYDVILLDEFQKIKIFPDSSILKILKEGRKFNFAVILSSQFLANYASDIVSAFLQCATNLFFRPIGKDATAITKQLQVDNPKAWERLLKELEVGEAILCGNYCLDDSERVMDTPIKVHIVN